MEMGGRSQVEEKGGNGPGKRSRVGVRSERSCRKVLVDRQGGEVWGRGVWQGHGGKFMRVGVGGQGGREGLWGDVTGGRVTGGERLWVGAGHEWGVLGGGHRWGGHG